ncbi:hypothetical protein BH09MYX1_BH09MYX1_63710 [soil metagenome]
MATVGLLVGAISCSGGDSEASNSDVCIVGGTKDEPSFHSHVAVGRASIDTDTLSSGGASRQRTVIRVDGALYIDATVERRSANAFDARMSFGRFFHGMRIGGSIDDQELAPFHQGEDPTLGDGSLLVVTLDDDAKRAVADLKTRSVGGTECGSLAAPDPTALGTGYSNPGHASFPEVSAGCIACNVGCASAAAGCAITTIAGCAGVVFPPAYAICLIVGGAICLGGFIGCTFACLDGEPCCPVTCGNGCCSSGESCLAGATQTCCAPDTTTCHATNGSGDANCCRGTDQCVADGSCCPTGRAVCDGVCCAPGNLCGVLPANGQKACLPCPSFRACGLTCCGDGQRCLNASAGTCCPIANPACQGNCCGTATDKCTGTDGATCCADKNACGITCCSATQGCAGEACSACLAGEQLCVPPNGPQHCCGPGLSCDQTGCCGVGQILCGSPQRCATPASTGGCP